jgi:hypothetical protein
MTETISPKRVNIRARVTLVMHQGPKCRPEMLDRIAVRLIERSIIQARAIAQRNSYANEPLDWLESTGAAWCETLGGEEYREKLAGVCRELRLMTDGRQTGRVRIPIRARRARSQVYYDRQAATE